MFRSRLSISGLFLIGALVLSGGSTYAEINHSDSANYVMPGCRNYVSDNPNGDLFKTGLCWGLISSLTLITDNSCVPTSATQRQAVAVVIQYIDARPARMHEDFRHLALEAMKAAWPCKK